MKVVVVVCAYRALHDYTRACRWLYRRFAPSLTLLFLPNLSLCAFRVDLLITGEIRGPDV